ncbi:MAG: SemiSWEET transporter [Flavipsychrobacter sp.]|nr:SemiSWEET transporter [Flavipsychrobacter sp.]
MDLIAITGIIAAVCTTSSFLPQAIKTIRTRDTSGISVHMYLVFTFGTAMWLTYGILSANTPVIAANAVTLVFALIILGYKIRYK